MANNQQSDQNQQSTRQGDSLSGSIQSADPGTEQRSEGLLPADGQDDDGRFEVAEEVSLDQQSDKLRRVGQAADLSADLSAEAAAVENDPDAATGNALPDPGKQSDG